MLKKILFNKVFSSIVKFFVFSFLLLYLFFVIFQRVTNNSAIMGYRVFTVATGSMEPVYKVNDVILVKTIDPKTLKVGDDIAYLGNRDLVKGMLVTHRIIKIEEVKGVVTYTLKGINNKYEDPTITSDQILGKVLGKVYIVSFINHLVKNIYGFFFLVFCPLVLVIFLEIADTVLDIKLEKKGIDRYAEEDDNEQEENEENLIGEVNNEKVYEDSTYLVSDNKEEFGDSYEEEVI